MAKKKQRRGLTDESDTPFSSRAVLTRGRSAVNAWLFALYGLIPGLGLVCGPIATILGVASRIIHRDQVTHPGRRLANASIVLGLLLWVTTWSGAWLICQAVL